MADEEALGSEIAVIIRAFVERHVSKLVARNIELEARIANLESRGLVKMTGTWLAEREYETGNLTIYNGSLWHAQDRTKSRPGSDSTWLLCTKQGTFSK